MSILNPSKSIYQIIRRHSCGKKYSLMLAIVAIVYCQLVLANTSMAQEIKWYPDLASATQAAAEQDKLVLMHFTAAWCLPSKTLDTFVYTNLGVQRAFNQNVVAVKIDVDEQEELVKQYGVGAVPFDIAITATGRVVAKRKSPRDASVYQKMVDDYHLILSDLAAGKSPALSQNLAELQGRLQRKPSNFSNRKSTFTPLAPTYQAPRPSAHSAELKRRAQVVSNPFVRDPVGGTAPSTHGSTNHNPAPLGPLATRKPSPQIITNRFHTQSVPAASQTTQALTPMNSAPKDFKPKSFAPDGFSPQPSAPIQSGRESTQLAGSSRPKSLNSPSQKVPAIANYPAKARAVEPSNIALDRLERSQLADQAVGDRMRRQIETLRTQPKVVMSDKYLGPSENKKPASDLITELDEKTSSATINIATGNDFAPLVSKPLGNADAKIVLTPEASSPVTTPAPPQVEQVATNDFVPFAIKPADPVASQTVGPKPTLINPPIGNIDSLIQTPFVIATQEKPQAIAQLKIDASLANAANAPEQLAENLRKDTPTSTPATDPASLNSTEVIYALHGKCPVTLLTESKWVDGDPQFGCVHRNRVYIFSSEENLRRFQKAPDASSPILAGYDPVLFR
ncbi:MAG: hypothetical protein ACI814_004706, partial [Mariniblastus sp.]